MALTLVHMLNMQGQIRRAVVSKALESMPPWHSLNDGPIIRSRGTRPTLLNRRARLMKLDAGAKGQGAYTQWISD